MVTKVEADILPGLEVSTGVDRSAGTLVASNRPELLKGLVTLNGGGVDTGADVDVVDRSVNSDLTLLLAAGRGVVGAEVLNDVVLDERVLGPSVNSEVAVAVDVVSTGVLDGASSTGHPALSTNVVTVSTPLHAELTTVAVGVGNGVGCISPEREVVATTCASSGLSALVEDVCGRVTLDNAGAVNGLRGGKGHDAGERRDGGEDRGEGNHFDDAGLGTVGD